MNTRKSNHQMSDKQLTSFVQEVTSALLSGKRHKIDGFGTFSTCARKATADQAACKIAMFRASAELRDYANGGARPSISGPHAEVVIELIETMRGEEGIDVPKLGRLAVIPVSGKPAKLIFHGADELNHALSGS